MTLSGLWAAEIAIEFTGIGVNDGQRAARRIGRSDGWRNGDRHAHKVRERFGGIQRFTAANTKYCHTLRFFRYDAQTVDFVL